MPFGDGSAFDYWCASPSKPFADGSPVPSWHVLAHHRKRTCFRTLPKWQVAVGLFFFTAPPETDYDEALAPVPRK
jgi:hypothetical protein